MKTNNEYDIYCPFDAEKHKAKYINYLEVLILENGKVVYAVPSHQEKAIALACEKHGLTRDELVAMCPREYYFDYLKWLLGMAEAMAVWNGHYEAAEVTPKQAVALKKLKLMGIYKGPLPMITETRGKA